VSKKWQIFGFGGTEHIRIDICTYIYLCTSIHTCEPRTCVYI